MWVLVPPTAVYMASRLATERMVPAGETVCVVQSPEETLSAYQYSNDVDAPISCTQKDLWDYDSGTNKNTRFRVGDRFTCKVVEHRFNAFFGLPRYAGYSDEAVTKHGEQRHKVS